MKKMWIRVLVLAAILAWPTVEAYRVWEAHEQLAAATQLEQKVSVRLADARGKAGAQVARTTSKD